MDKKEEKQRKSPVNASSLTTIAAASIVAIVLILPLYFGAITQTGINAYGQLIPPSQLQQGGGSQSVIINGAGATFPFPLIDTWRVVSVCKSKRQHKLSIYWKWRRNQAVY
jgi:hypothetical protein